MSIGGSEIMEQNSYEMTLVFKPTLDDAGIKAEYEAIVEIMNRFEMNVAKIDDWGRRRLAYEINKTNEGFFRFVTFNSPNESIKELESRMRIRENILRYLIIKNEPGRENVKIEAPKQDFSTREEREDREEAEKVAAKAARAASQEAPAETVEA
jgi:small subunit ribosomal protein S6